MGCTAEQANRENKPPGQSPSPSSVDLVETVGSASSLGQTSIKVKTKPSVWNTLMEETLIDLVQEHPLLWNPKDPDYKNRDAKLHLYIVIANKISEAFPQFRMTPTAWSDVRKKFQNLRTYKMKLTADLEKMKNKSGSEGGECLVRWPHFHRMEFLRDTFRGDSSISSLDYIPSQVVSAVISSPDENSSLSPDNFSPDFEDFTPVFVRMVNEEDDDISVNGRNYEPTTQEEPISESLEMTNTSTLGLSFCTSDVMTPVRRPLSSLNIRTVSLSKKQLTQSSVDDSDAMVSPGAASPIDHTFRTPKRVHKEQPGPSNPPTPASRNSRKRGRDSDEPFFQAMENCYKRFEKSSNENASKCSDLNITLGNMVLSILEHSEVTNETKKEFTVSLMKLCTSALANDLTK